MKLNLNGLHKAFESRIRLGIMSSLVVNRSVDFNELKVLLDVTDGNLASHLKGLEKEGFVAVEKSFIGRKTNTSYVLTSEGRSAFEAHLSALEALLATRR